MKEVRFIDSARNDLRDFPKEARREAGFELDSIQNGLEPHNWKPMPSVGPGVREIRIKDENEIYRVIYIAAFEEAVYVLHAFQKKTQKTRKSDIDLAKNRLKALKRYRRRS